MTRRTRLSVEALDERALPSLVAHYSYPVNHYPDAVVTGDFNGDGKLDVVVANGQFDGIAFGFDNTVSVLLGLGDGTFRQPPLTSPTGSDPLSIAAGDFNSDGKLDVATANDYDVSVLLGNGDGTFQPPSTLGVGAGNPASVAVGDFNGDGKLDLGVTSNATIFQGWDYYGYPMYGPEGSANVLLGNGDGTFSGPNVTDLGAGYLKPAGTAAAADLNGDGLDDFVTVYEDYGAVSVALGDASGYLVYGGYFSAGYWAVAVAAGDVNGDGSPDLVTANSSGNNIGVLLGDGAGGFAPAVNYPAGGSPTGVVLGDFTGDGKLDIATANSSSNTASVLYGNGDGTFSSPLNSFAEGNRIAAGDFNSDGWLDAAVAWIGEVTNSYNGDILPLINDHSWSTPSVPSVSINDVSVTEGNTGSVTAIFTVTLSAASGQPITVHYATANGTAAAGSDYTAASGNLTFAPGQTSKTVTVQVKGDRLPEANETIAVNLSAPTNATISDGQGVGTILDNEPRIGIGDVRKQEGKKNQTTQFTFTVTLSAAYDQPVTVSFKTTDGTATTGDSDYLAKTGTITFKPGETTKTITIEVKGDNKKESEESFYLDLFGNSGNSLFTRNRGTGTILNDD